MDLSIRMAASHPACKLLSRHKWKRKNSRVCRYCYSVSMANIVVCFFYSCTYPFWCCLFLLCQPILHVACSTWKMGTVSTVNHCLHVCCFSDSAAKAMSDRSVVQPNVRFKVLFQQAEIRRLSPLSYKRKHGSLDDS